MTSCDVTMATAQKGHHSCTYLYHTVLSQKAMELPLLVPHKHTQPPLATQNEGRNELYSLPAETCVDTCTNK